MRERGIEAGAPFLAPSQELGWTPNCNPQLQEVSCKYEQNKYKSQSGSTENRFQVEADVAPKDFSAPDPVTR